MIQKSLFRFIFLILAAGAVSGIASASYAGGGGSAGLSDAASDSLKVLGHASVKINTADGIVIYIDPYAGTDYADSANIVLITHQHGDHNKLSLVTQKPSCTVIQNFDAIKSGVYQSFTVGAVKIDAVPAYNANHPKGTGVGYILTFNGKQVYHAGDTGKIEEMADLAERHIDYAMLPMDGIYNMGPEVAMEAAELIQARHYIPIHTKPGGYSAEIVARFTLDSKIEVKPGETIALEAQETKVGHGTARLPLFRLEQNYPNPFNPETTLSFSLERQAAVKLVIYDGLGRPVQTLLSRDLCAGSHGFVWNAGDLCGGVYFCRLHAGGGTETRKLLLVR
ncbi:MBL fold metallo-hydrolase [bacterium]|nr:MBL fold metallo-hydrolase [bacterium]